MELRQYFSIVWKWLWLIVLSTGVAATFSLLATARAPRIYQASSTLLVGQSIQNPNPNAQEIITAQQLALTYIQIAKTESVLQGVIDALELRTSPERLRQNTSASIIQGTQLIELRVLDTDPPRAQATANELASQLILQGPVAKADSTVRRDFLQKQVQDLEKKIQDAQTQMADLQKSISVTASAREIADKQQEIAALQSQVNQWQVNYGSLLGILAPRSPNFLSVIEPARLPTDPVSPNVPVTVMLAMAIGAVIALSGAFLIEYIDDTMKLPDDVSRTMKLAVLGLVAKITGETAEDKLISAKHPRSSHAEAYRVLRTNIQFADVDKPIHTLLVTSANPSEGKSVTAANLAVVMAQSGRRVVLVDADMRRPSQHRYFQMTNDHGLAQGLLQAQAELDGHVRATSVENLRVITTGGIPPNPAELLGSKRMQTLIETLKAEADIIIFDTPPCLPLADAAILSRYVDGVLMVVDAGRTRRESAIHAKETMERAGAHILGVSMNRVNAHGNNYYYYYYYYSHDGQGKKGFPEMSNPLARLFQRPTANKLDE